MKFSKKIDLMTTDKHTANPTRIAKYYLKNKKKQKGTRMARVTKNCAALP